MRDQKQQEFKRKPLNGDEAQRLENACQTAEEKRVIFGLLDTGLRVAEFSSIKRENLDTQNHWLTFLGKGKKERTIKLSPRLQLLIEPELALQDTLGLSVRTIQRVVKRVAKRAAIAKATSPHVLRHTWAVRTVQKGASLPAIMKWMGHQHLRTTQIYMNLAPADAIKEIESTW